VRQEFQYDAASKRDCSRILISVADEEYCRMNNVMQVTYFVWVSLATVLLLSITAMNWSTP
jgi:tryptophan-rich sensory protein